jgi:predicted porin
MKKLLAIAVAAAITVPMAASADTKVYGKGHVSLSSTKKGSAAASKWNVKSHASRIGLKGSNALDNGLTATHKFEMGANISDKSKCTTAAPVAPATEGIETCNGGLTDRDAWVGLKGGFGEVRIGRHTVPSDIMDDAADFTTHGAGLNGSGRANNALAYIGGFGNVGVALARVQDGSGEATHDLMANYSAGPLYAGVGVNAPEGGKAGAKVGLAYKGANYGVGLVAGKRTLSKAQNTANAKADTFTTVSGKYSFGKAWVGGQFSTEKDSKAIEHIVEAGYKLGKKTKAYGSYTIGGTDTTNGKKKTPRIGLIHAF